MRPLLLAVLVLSVGFVIWGFAESSFSTGTAVTGALGAVLLGLAVWIAERLLWVGPPRELPHFASPVQLSLRELQGRWTREDGKMYEVRGLRLCPEDAAQEKEELRRAGLPSDPCSELMQDEGGRLIFLVDDQGVPARTDRRWGREVLAAKWSGLTFSRPVPGR